MSVVLWAAEQIARGEEPRAQPSSPLVYRPVEALPRQDVRPVARERGRGGKREREMGKELWDADREPPSLGNMAITHQQNVSIVCRDPLTRDAAGRQPVRHLHTCKCDCMGCRARGRGAESNPTLRQAGEAEAATLTEAEASPGEAAAPGSASCLAGAVLALEDQRPAAAAVAKAAALAEPISN